MTQFTSTVNFSNEETGATLLNELRQFLAGALTSHLGVTSGNYFEPGTFWIQTDGNAWDLNIRLDNNEDKTILTINNINDNPTISIPINIDISSSNNVSGILPLENGGIGIAHGKGIGINENETFENFIGRFIEKFRIDDYVTQQISDIPEPNIPDQIPVGTINAFAGLNEPSGWLICNGRLVSKTIYSNLFNILGTIYGDGSTLSFNLPDLRGEFIRGFDSGRGVDSNRIFGSSQDDEFKEHSHTISTGSTAFGGPQKVRELSLYRSGSETTSSSGGNETRPRNIALNYIIKF